MLIVPLLGGCTTPGTSSPLAGWGSLTDSAGNGAAFVFAIGTHSIIVLYYNENACAATLTILCLRCLISVLV